MKAILPVAFLAVLLSTAGPAVAEDAVDREEAALRRLGQLNGLALHCKDLDRVRAIKQAVIRGVPKVRDYGEEFEEATNAAYLDAVNRRLPCPAQAQMENDVNAAVAHMTQVFAED